jgi:hypothetical protein
MTTLTRLVVVTALALIVGFSAYAGVSVIVEIVRLETGR